MGSRGAVRVRSAFTLIELLVVISIIAVLAAMLMPVFARSREKARAIACVSNLKQLSQAFQMYFQDNDDAMPDEFHSGWPPPWDYWGGWEGYRIELQPYLANMQVFICPSEPNTYVSYGLPMWNVMAKLYWGVVFADSIASPSDTILLAENWNTYYSSRDPAHTNNFAPNGNIAWDRHNGGANYLFLDGHVKWMAVNQTYSPVCLWWPWPHAPVRMCSGRDH